MNVKPIIVIFFCVLSNMSFADQSNVEKLGYKQKDKLLIIHADDIGLNHSTNSAVINAFENGYINSGSIMVPAPKFKEFATFSKNNPQFDLGLHITFTSEWRNLRWGGILPKMVISSLLDKDGFFYPNSADFAKNAKLDEVELEFRAQIERAIQSGIKPSHLDTHMAALFENIELFSLYLELGREYKIPTVIPLNFISNVPSYMDLLQDKDFGLDSYLFVSFVTEPSMWASSYNELIDNLKPSEVNQLTFHIAYDDDDMAVITDKNADFGSKWRQRDMDYVSALALKEKLKLQGVKLVTWSQIQRLIYK
jgi:predicted glycoside hydrolase/deacetylase ChbG (UPF0249 family)